MDGVFNIRKDRGMTSHDVVDRVRRVIGMRRVGHTGTLDPDAVGVLPVCVGKATRIVQFLIDSDKEYQATMELGVVTDTQDSTGRVIERKECTGLTDDGIRNVFSQFTGELEQVPPMVSAVRVQGRRLYQLARKGQEVERVARKVRIFELEILRMELPHVRFRVVCSKGTYVRTLCADIGEKLGCGAHQAELIRTRSGPFRIEDAVSLQELQDLKDPSSRLLPIDLAVSHLPIIRVKPWFERFLKAKVMIPPEELLERTLDVEVGRHVRVHGRQGRLLAVAEVLSDPSGQSARLYRTVRMLTA